MPNRKRNYSPEPKTTKRGTFPVNKGRKTARMATTTGGCRYLTGKGVVAATTNGALLPFNWTQVVKVSPGEQLSTVSNDGVGGTLVVVELVD